MNRKMEKAGSPNKAMNLLNNLMGGQFTEEQKRSYKNLRYAVTIDYYDYYDYYDCYRLISLIG